MIARRAAILLAGLMILPEGWIAASAGPETLTAARPVIGAFGLDPAPQQGGLARGVVPPGTMRLMIDGRDTDFAEDRHFIVGFGRDYASSTQITARLAGGRIVTQTLPVTPTAWAVEKIATRLRRSQPDPAFLARRAVELEQIDAARHVMTGATGWRQTFVWPVSGRISGQFGAQRFYAGQPAAPHGGVDIAAKSGTPVLAPADGVVILAAASPFTLEGSLVMIDHGMGLNSAFLHLSHIDVRIGDTVQQGQPIGTVGMTGRATGPHLHWGMKWQNERIDPARVAQAKN